MNRIYWSAVLLATSVIVGCHSDIVTTSRLKELEYKCVYIAPLESEDPHVGKVIRDIIEKEFMRKKVQLCEPDSATVFITGATFLTVRSTSDRNILGGSSASSQAVESVSVVAKDNSGEILLSASYDNKERYTASELAKEFGSALADKLK